MANLGEYKSKLQAGKTQGRRSWDNQTTGEKRQRLQSARQRQNGNLARFEFGRKHAGIADPDQQNELLLTPELRSLGARDLFDVAEIETKRKAALQVKRLGQLWGAKAMQESIKEQSPETEPDQEGLDTKQILQQSKIVAFLENTRQQLLTQKQSEQKIQATDEEVQKMRKLVKEKTKAAVKRGLIYLITLIMTALDLGTWVTFVVDIFLKIFTLGWLNLEMIYGRWFAKGKSKFISPISWEPIPMPIDKEAVFMQVAIVAADIFFAIALIIFFGGAMCILHDYLLVVFSPVETATNLAKSGQGMCLGAIIGSIFGL